MKFGNLVTYKGKSLAKAKTKAENGNLVFAEITEGDDKGFYIFAGGAEGHMVTKADFDSFKKDAIDRITELERLTDMPQNAETGKEMTVVEYVAAQITALQLGDASKKAVAAGITADEAGLTTGAQVYAHVSGEVAALEESISGVIGDLDDYVLKTSVKDSFDDAADDNVASVGAVKAHVSSAVGNFSATLGAAAYASVTKTVAKGGEGLTTGGAVADYVDAEIGKLGTVMSFIGVVKLDEGQAFDTTNATVSINGKTKTAENGDVVIVGSKEYVWDGTSWKEFGDASAEAAAIADLKTKVETNSGAIATNSAAIATNSGAIAALSATVGTIAGEDAIGFADNTITLKIAKGDAAGNVILTQDANGLKAEVAAETLAYAGETLEGETKPTTDATNVKDALNDLFKSDKVASAAINDLNERLDDISGVVGVIEHTSVSDGDATDFVAITETTEGSHKNYAVSATVVKGTSGDAGLATDAYVREQAAAAVDTALTWEVLKDDDANA